jgi:serine phosphatase RsbU (regulator of sigma subunit)
MARLRGALAGLAITGAPPHQLVGWLNELVCHVAPEHTASVVAGYFDPATRMLTWAQAGHPPPVLVRGSRAWTMPQPEGILLGAGNRSNGYHVATQQLFQGDLLLYSDGLVERRDRSIDDGLSTLIAAAGGVADPDDVICTVLAAMGNTATDDDTCLVALQVL